MTVKESMEAYLISSPPSCRSRLPHFLAYCEGKVDELGRLREEHLADYEEQMLESLRPLTHYARVNAVRLWLKWATHQGHLSVNPTAHWQPRRPANQLGRPVPSPAQVQALLAAPNPDTLAGRRDRMLLEFLYGTGLRLRECARVNCPDLDLRRRTVKVGDRYQPMGQHLTERLRRYLLEVRPRLLKEPTKALFIAELGRPMQVFSISLRLRKYSDAAFSVDSLRIAFATHLLHNGAPLEAVQKLLGFRRLHFMRRFLNAVDPSWT